MLCDRLGNWLNNLQNVSRFTAETIPRWMQRNTLRRDGQPSCFPTASSYFIFEGMQVLSDRLVESLKRDGGK